MSVTNESQHVVNGRIGWAFEHVDAPIYARNLFDEHYLTYHDRAISGDPNAIPTYIVGDPREVGVSLTVHL